MWKAAPGALVVALALMLAGAGQASAQEPLWLNYGCTAESIGLHGVVPRPREAELGLG